MSKNRKIPATITAIAKNNKKAKATTKVTVGKVVKTLKFKEGKKKTASRSSLAMANPIPVAPPVTMAVFPFKEISFFIMLSFRENVKKQQKIFKIKKKSL